MDIQSKQCNPNNYKKGRDKSIEYIVIHYTANNGDTARNNINYFAATVTKTSAHYFVDENPTIWQSVEDKDTAWHCGATNPKHPKCRNANSIGIEMCSRKDALGRYYIKDETVTNAVELTKLLMKVYNVPIGNILRHYDVTGKSCPEPFVRDEALWKAFLARLSDRPVAAPATPAAPAANATGAAYPVKDSNLTAMAALGVMNTPDYWRGVNVQYLDELLTKAANGTLDKRIDNGITDLNIALGVLSDAGIMNSADYWKGVLKTVNYMDGLLINLANRCRVVLEKIIHAEACGEPFEGQVLVGNVIINRCKAANFPNGIHGVVFEKNQFTPVTDGAYKRAVPSASVKKAVDNVLAGVDNSRGALYFCTKASAAKGNWHERALEFLFECGNHRFYR